MHRKFQSNCKNEKNQKNTQAHNQTIAIFHPTARGRNTLYTVERILWGGAFVCYKAPHLYIMHFGAQRLCKFKYNNVENVFFLNTYSPSLGFIIALLQRWMHLIKQTNRCGIIEDARLAIYQKAHKVLQ